MLKEKIDGELLPLRRLREFRKLPKSEQDAILTREAEELAVLYREDMAKPPAERDLTAFMLLDGIDPIREPEDGPN